MNNKSPNYWVVRATIGRRTTDLIKQDMLAGERVQLRPMCLPERKLFFRWATRSDATPWWYGERYGDSVPGYEAFKVDWHDAYFTDGQPEKGRAFKIMYLDEAIGQINYNEIHPADLSTEMDILIAANQHHGLGLGTDAIRTLTRYLFESLHVSRVRVEVIPQNIPAIRAYEKAGYRRIYTYILNGIEWRVLEMLNPAMQAGR